MWLPFFGVKSKLLFAATISYMEMWRLRHQRCGGKIQRQSRPEMCLCSKCHVPVENRWLCSRSYSSRWKAQGHKQPFLEFHGWAWTKRWQEMMGSLHGYHVSLHINPYESHQIVYFSTDSLINCQWSVIVHVSDLFSNISYSCEFTNPSYRCESILCVRP